MRFPVLNSDFFMHLSDESCFFLLQILGIRLFGYHLSGNFAMESSVVDIRIKGKNTAYVLFCRLFWYFYSMPLDFLLGIAFPTE